MKIVDEESKRKMTKKIKKENKIMNVLKGHLMD